MGIGGLCGPSGPPHLVLFKNLKVTLWERERGGKIWENGIETCKISCMK